MCSTSGSVLVNCKFALSNIKRQNSNNKYILWRENIDIQFGWLALSKNIVSVVYEKHIFTCMHSHRLTQMHIHKVKAVAGSVFFPLIQLYYVTEGSMAHKSTLEKWKFIEKNEQFIDEYNPHSLISYFMVVKNMAFKYKLFYY